MHVSLTTGFREKMFYKRMAILMESMLFFSYLQQRAAFKHGDRERVASMGMVRIGDEMKYWCGKGVGKGGRRWGSLRVLGIVSVGFSCFDLGMFFNTDIEYYSPE